MISSLAKLLDLMRHHGGTRFYAKKLAPNDNSKNQVYLGGDFSALNVIPHGEIVTDTRTIAGSKQDRPKASVRFFWVDGAGRHLAPNAQLILYPDYPEVRMSGFLKGCVAAPNDLMTVRDEGRIFIFGITPNGEMLGYVVDAMNPLAAEIRGRDWEALGVFLELSAFPSGRSDPKSILLSELKRIYELRWIASQKLARDGSKRPYAARNGGGYTLEAELGISPNGYSEPDFLGWEIKQYGVTDFVRFVPSSPVTLFTPEPNGGVYKDAGVASFLKRFGYADKAGKADRFNFGGIYVCNRNFHPVTGLKMVLEGFDPANGGRITDIEGSISLQDKFGEPAAIWSFTGLMQHWNRKHSQAAYVPSMFRTPPPEYSYAPQVLLCERTDFILFLKAFYEGAVYYDPGIKIENASSTRPGIKRRSQFRTKHRDLTRMYHGHEIVKLV